MLKNIFLIPIGDSISGKLIPQLLCLHKWCLENNSEIRTICGKPHNFARNALATKGWGFTNTSPPDAENLIWIDSDIVFSIKQIEKLISFEHKFCCGWYISNESEQVMAGYWNIDFFKKNFRMPFLSAKWLVMMKNKNPWENVEVDFTGFGFVKIHRSIIEKMKYPFFTLNIQNIDNIKNIIDTNENKRIIMCLYEFYVLICICKHICIYIQKHMCIYEIYKYKVYFI